MTDPIKRFTANIPRRRRVLCPTSGIRYDEKIEKKKKKKKEKE